MADNDQSDEVVVTQQQVSDRNAAALADEKKGYVTVRQLRDQLAELPDDAIVVLSSDPEGNNFDTFSDVGIYWYADRWGDGEIHNLNEDADELVGDEIYAAVLWP